MVSFKHDLILLRYFLEDSVFLVFYHRYFHIQCSCIPNIIYSYWFIILLFFIMLKKISNISNYSVFNCFIFFFSLKRFLISLIAVSFVSFCSFFNLKRFLTSLIMLVLCFYLLQALDVSSLYVLKKIIISF